MRNDDLLPDTLGGGLIFERVDISYAVGSRWFERAKRRGIAQMATNKRGPELAPIRQLLYLQIPKRFQPGQVCKRE